MGNAPQDWEDSGRVPPQGVPLSRKYADEEVHVGQVCLPTAGRVDGGSGEEIGGYVGPLTTEYRQTVYFHSANTRATYGDRAMAGSEGDDGILGAGRT